MSKPHQSIMKIGEFKVLSIPAPCKPGLKITRTQFGILLQNYNNPPTGLEDILGIVINYNEIDELIRILRESQIEQINTRLIN